MAKHGAMSGEMFDIYLESGSLAQEAFSNIQSLLGLSLASCPRVRLSGPRTADRQGQKPDQAIMFPYRCVGHHHFGLLERRHPPSGGLPSPFDGYRLDHLGLQWLRTNFRLVQQVSMGNGLSCRPTPSSGSPSDEPRWRSTAAPTQTTQPTRPTGSRGG